MAQSLGARHGESPIVGGAEILPLGLAATIRRNDPSQALSVIIQTDNGRCELSSDPVKARYIVNASLTVSGTSLQPVSKDFRQSLGNSQSCTEGWTQRSFLQCIDGDRITEIAGPFIHSAANNGTANYTRDGQASGKPACAMFHYGYSDRGRGTLGDCKGNGWIDASFTLKGVKSVPASGGPFQGSRDIEIELDAGTVFTIDGSAIGGGINGQNWSYVADIQKVVGGIVQFSAELSPNVPQFKNVVTSISPNGLLSIQINPN